MSRRSKSGNSSTLFVLLVCLITYLVISADEISVKIGEKQFIGFESLVFEQTIYGFTGIPYAEPPVGPLRFKKPVPANKEGLVVANEWPKACPQLDDKLEQSEDCLKLNVWTPDLTGDKPVLVWIHGGGFAAGFGQNGEMLARLGDSVVVTLNYRLGTLGFLHTGTEEAPGNVGLWDQVMALEWVNDNIRYFGGNPAQITLFGFSAGSRSVSLHMLSHHSRQLFRNAIMMSGATTSPLSQMCPKYVKRIHHKLATKVGCSHGQDFTDETLECLRDVSPDRLVSAQHSPDVLELSYGQFPNIIFGDEFIHEKPSEMLTKRDQKKKINLLIGTTEDEGSWIWNKHIDPIRHSLTDPTPNLTRSDAIKELAQILNDIKIEPKIDGQLVAESYLQTIPENSDSLRKSMAIALGDLFISCPSLKFADTVFRNDPKRNKIYGYYWTSKGNNWNEQDCGRWAGACHGADVGPAFGEPFRNDHSTDQERDISVKLINTFAHFAKYNRPPPQEDIEWPHYFLLDDKTISPYYEFSKQLKDNTNFGVGLKSYVCEQIWNKLY